MSKQLQRAADSAEAIMKHNASLLGEVQINGNQLTACLESGLKISQPERFLQVTVSDTPVTCLKTNLTDLFWI